MGAPSCPRTCGPAGPDRAQAGHPERVGVAEVVLGQERQGPRSRARRDRRAHAPEVAMVDRVVRGDARDRRAEPLELEALEGSLSRVSSAGWNIAQDPRSPGTHLDQAGGLLSRPAARRASRKDRWNPQHSRCAPSTRNREPSWNRASCVTGATVKRGGSSTGTSSRVRLRPRGSRGRSEAYCMSGTGSPATAPGPPAPGRVSVRANPCTTRMRPIGGVGTRPLGLPADAGRIQ